MLSALRSRVMLQRLAQGGRKTATTATTARRHMAHMPVVPQSQTAVLFDGHPAKEGWEFTMAWWYSTSFVLICLVVGSTPDTDIAAWAQHEAAARLKMAEEGKEAVEFGTHCQDVVQSQNQQAWDIFASKSLNFGDDDDDDDEDDDDDDEDDE